MQIVLKEVKPDSKKPVVFPCIMKHTTGQTFYVLGTAYTPNTENKRFNGVILMNDVVSSIGTYKTDFFLDAFEAVQEIITIEFKP